MRKVLKQYHGRLVLKGQTLEIAQEVVLEGRTSDMCNALHVSYDLVKYKISS